MGNIKEINHFCVLCGTGYHACDTCNQERTFTPWRTLTDTIEHYKIFTVLKDYNNGLIDRKRAKELLSLLDLSGKGNYKESAKRVLEDIYSEVNIEPTLLNNSPKRKSHKSSKTNIENEIFPESEIQD